MYQECYECEEKLTLKEQNDPYGRIADPWGSDIGHACDGCMSGWGDE